MAAASLALVAATSAAARPLAHAAAAPGSFTLSGPISGKVALTAKTCTAAKSAADLQFVWEGGVKTLKGVSTKSIVTIELDLSGSAYGRSGALKQSATGNPPFLTFGATNANPLKPASDWQSVSGTFSTTAKGASGRVSAVLTSTSGQKGRLSVKGSWSGCPVAKS